MADAGSDWTDREVDLIVAVDMLGIEPRGEIVVKARRNATLEDLTTRSRALEISHFVL